VALLLTVLGILVLLPSVAGILFGGFMALDPKTRGAGVLFVLWWVPGVVAAVGVLIRDPATFVMGLLCFAVAGLAMTLEERWSHKPTVRRIVPSPNSEKTTQENVIRERSEDTS
jgi:hypothetical protein